MNHILEFNFFKKRLPKVYKEPDIEDIRDRLLSFKEDGVDINVRGTNRHFIEIEVKWKIDNKPHLHNGTLLGAAGDLANILISNTILNLGKRSSDKILMPIVKKLNSIGYKTEYHRDNTIVIDTSESEYEYMNSISML